MTVCEAVQDTLFRQFLGGADPARRLAGSAGEEAEGHRPPRVEDLPWWRYDRPLALWHCEWLDAYYDSSDRAFFRRDELTRLLEPADLAELREHAGRLRLQLPEHDEPAPDWSEMPLIPDDAFGDPGDAELPERGQPDPDLEAGNGAGEGSEAALSQAGDGALPGGAAGELGAVEPGDDRELDAGQAVPESAAPAGGAADGGAADGGWHDAAAAAAAGQEEEEEEEPSWIPDGQGNLTHWCAATGRMFLWQERAGVLHEYLPANRAAGATARYCALWAAEGPLCALGRADDPEVSRLVDHRGVELGSAPEEAAGWALDATDVLPSHARVFPSSAGHWWAEPLVPGAEVLVDGRRAGDGRAVRLHHGAVLRLGAILELRVDLPDWPGAPPRGGGGGGGPQAAADGSAAGAAVLESPFLPSEPWAPVPAPLAGAERARALNAALRRALCRPSARERAEMLEREARYGDQAAKRRRLHPEPTAADALLRRKAEVLAALFGQGDGAPRQAPELPEAAELYMQEVAETADAQGRFVGEGGVGHAGVGYRPPATGAQRLAAARRPSKGPVRFVAAEGSE